MVAPCGCRVLLDTDGKNPTRMFGRVKPDLGAVEGEIPLNLAAQEGIALPD